MNGKEYLESIGVNAVDGWFDGCPYDFGLIDSENCHEDGHYCEDCIKTALESDIPKEIKDKLEAKEV